MAASALVQLVFLLVTVNAQEIEYARGKKVFYCLDHALPDSVTDGTIDPKNPVISDEKCSPIPYLSVQLDGLFYLSHVVFYAGEYDTTKPFGEMDYLLVQNKFGKEAFLCGQYPSPMVLLADKERRRVNCVDPFRLSDTVELILFKNVGYNLADLEVFGFYSNETIYNSFFRGCFKHFASSNFREFNTTYMGCIEFCLGSRFPFAAIKDLKECRCGYEYDNKFEVSLRKCDIMCPGLPDKRCGGRNGYHAVYLLNFALPRYVGCKELNLLSKDSEKRGVTSGKSFKHKEMTLAKCIKFCEEYFSLLLTDGDTCNCTDEQFPYMTETGHGLCKKTCNGDLFTHCGDVQYASVYSTCMIDSDIRTKCSTIMRCKNVDDRGMCDGECQKSFKGDYCLARDVDYDIDLDCVNDKPCKKTPFSDCTMEELKHKCVCWTGFLKQSDGSCQDINECDVEDKCDNKTATCVNLNGTYFCECRPGHLRKSNFTCDPYIFKPKQKTGSVTYTVLLIILPLLSSIITAVVLYNNGSANPMFAAKPTNA